MSTKYAIICAAHDSNSGMYSVDRAAKHFFAARHADFDLVVTQEKQGRAKDHYVLVESWDDLETYDKIVYWGDFLINPAYGYHSYPWRDNHWGTGNNRTAAIAKWRHLFNPETAPEGRQLFAVGQNFQHDLNVEAEKYPRMLGEEGFSPHLRNLENSYSAIFVRDILSLQNLSREVSFSYLDQVRLGLDCAFLQNRENETAQPRGTFAYYFSRSRLEGTQQLVDHLEGETGLNGIKLDRWLSLKRAGREEHFASMKASISGAAFVLTDTYHVAVNAMHSRRPVIVIGRQTSQQSGTLGDYKKKALLRMLDLERFYHEVDGGILRQADHQAVAELVAKFFAENVSASPYALLDAKTEEFARNVEDVVLS